MIDFSINVTVFNKGFLIDKVLESIVNNTVGNYEIVVVLDGCTDDSESVVHSFFKEHKKVSHKILYADNVFETKANNIAAKASTGDYIIIVQDDMIINEHGWNTRLAKPTLEFSDTFAVTARTAHNWIYNENSKHIDLSENLSDCWCDILIHTDHAERGKIDRNTFAVRDSVNRGPLLIKHDILESLEYFDEIYSPQELDDHDLCYRAYNELGMVCGCYWVDIISDHAWGGTRPDGANPAPWLFEANHHSTKILFQRHKDLIMRKKHNEDRRLI